MAASPSTLPLQSLAPRRQGAPPVGRTVVCCQVAVPPTFAADWDLLAVACWHFQTGGPPRSLPRRPSAEGDVAPPGLSKPRGTETRLRAEG